MPNGYRSLAFAASIAALLIAFGLGIYTQGLNSPKQERYQPYRYATDEPIQLKSSGSIPPQAPEYRAPCDNPKGREEADLCAQWKSAYAAEDSAFWTKWGFWAGIGGMIGLFWTLYYTREAVKDTGKATAAMQRQNTIAEQGQRPWLVVNTIFIDELTPAVTHPEGEPAKWFRARISIKNIGKLPALDSYCVRPSGFLKPSDDWQKVYDLAIKYRANNSGCLAPGEEREFYCNVSGKDEDFIRDDPDGIFWPFILRIAIGYRSEADGDWHCTDTEWMVSKEINIFGSPMGWNSDDIKAAAPNLPHNIHLQRSIRMT